MVTRATTLADLSAYEQIKDFVLLTEPFSAAAGTMACTAELRREALEALYNE
jgi:hypothetical protein